MMILPVPAIPFEIPGWKEAIPLVAEKGLMDSELDKVPGELKSRYTDWAFAQKRRVVHKTVMTALKNELPLFDAKESKLYNLCIFTEKLG
jgi:hypothetical protein